MNSCKDCVCHLVCAIYAPNLNDILANDGRCSEFKKKADLVEVVRCNGCKHGRLIDKRKTPEKYFRDDAIVCECEDVVGDEPMIYPPSHFCSYGERK